MQKEEILEILNDWNFWQKQQFTGIKRQHLLKKITKLNSLNFALSIIGPRRSGKSVLIKQFAKQLIDEGISARDILIVNFEDYKWREFDIGLLDKIYSVYLEEVKANNPQTPYIFLDEIHRIPEWERFVRTILEKRQAHVFISGSSANLLSKELATLLTGRNLILEVFPLDFHEYLGFSNIYLKERLDIVSKKHKILNAFKEYIEFGGFPEVILSDNKKTILAQYFQDIIGKDILKRYKVRREDKLNALAKFYLSNISNPITFRKIEKFLNIPLLTVEMFSEYMQSAYLIFLLRRFSFSVKEQDNSPKKVYCYDVGLANALGFRFSKNIGRLYENIVALQLKKKMSQDKGLEVFYWQSRDGKEADFVIKKGLEVHDVIQVCFDISEFQVKDREVKGLLKALVEFRLKKGIVITEDYSSEEKIKDKIISYIPLWRWLLQNN